HAEFVVIQPARRTLSVPARLFLERFEAEIAHIQAIWDRALAGPGAANGRNRTGHGPGRSQPTTETTRPLRRHSGAPRSGEPGIHNPGLWLWIPSSLRIQLGYSQLGHKMPITGKPRSMRNDNKETASPRTREV